MAEDDPNSLLLKWLKEWLDEAKFRNNKSATTYKRAYESLKACPLHFAHPSEAKSLKGLGDKLCSRLTDKLQEHCAENGLQMPVLARKGRKRRIGDELLAPSPPKKQRKAKLYIPTKRSGPYAILLVLSTLSETTTSGYTKVQLIELAQPHCDSSFTAPSDPTKFYTTWDSVKTLESKDLICDFGRPTKKYMLTKEGWDVANSIRKTLSDDELSKVGKQQGETSQAGPSQVGTSQPLASESAELQPSGYQVSGQQHSRIIDLEGEQEDEEVQIRKAIAESLKEEAARRSKPTEAPPRSRTDTAQPRAGMTYSAAANTKFLELLSSPAASNSHSSRSWGERPQNSSVDLSTSHKPARAASTNPPVVSTKQPSFEPFRIASGAFTVELVLDNREVRSKTDRDYIQDELRNRGIQPIVKSMEVGDALWVAKCKDPLLLSRLGEEGDEIVLDYIVERKRLDDLVSSIKDGRFQEQKFRLQKSGVKNVVYVVEEITMSLEASQHYHEHIMSAIASSQVVNGYFVKRTKKLDDTIRYLASMTMMLKSLYESRPLLLIPSSSLFPSTYPSLLTSLPQPHHITYTSFAALASKSDSLTVRDIFLKMLMCTRGITGDKALEIQKHWPTPRAFVEALEACQRRDDLGSGVEGDGAKRRQELVWRVAGGFVGTRKIGKKVSANVGDIWGEA